MRKSPSFSPCTRRFQAGGVTRASRSRCSSAPGSCSRSSAAASGTSPRRRRRGKRTTWPVTSPRPCPLAPSGAGTSRAGTCIGRARCIASSAGCRSTRPWPTAPSPNRCIPMTISAPPSIAICATADANSIRASACAMPTDIGSACGYAVTSRATRRRRSLCSRQSPPSSSRRLPPPSTPMRGSATPWRPSRKPSCCGTTRTAW